MGLCVYRPDINEVEELMSFHGRLIGNPPDPPRRWQRQHLQLCPHTGWTEPHVNISAGILGPHMCGRVPGSCRHFLSFCIRCGVTMIREDALGQAV